MLHNVSQGDKTLNTSEVVEVKDETVRVFYYLVLAKRDYAEIIKKVVQLIFNLTCSRCDLAHPASTNHNQILLKEI